MNILTNKLNGACAFALTLMVTSGLVRANDKLELMGLATYTETARDMYVAGLLLAPGAGLENVYLAPGPKAMEYRIATRRISSRGFFGTLLLQSELGTADRAPTQLIDVLQELKTNIKGTLVHGDQFQIHLSESDSTTFVLNNTELLTVDDGAVFDFFFAGWVGDNASSLLRDSLLTGDLNRDTLAHYKQLSPAGEREALVAEWMAPPPAPVVLPEPEPELELVAAPIEVQIAAVAPATAVIIETTVATTAESLQATTDLIAAIEPEMDDREYQRQLSDYLNHIMSRVFGAVEYPRRAIKRGKQGKVELLARLDGDGKLLDITLDNSSGHGMLDRAAQEAVETAAPFPELTPVAQEEFLAEDGESYVVMIPVTFRLQ